MTKSPTSVRLPDELVEEIEEQLEYGDSKSEWIREAIEQRFEREDEAQDATPDSAADEIDMHEEELEHVRQRLAQKREMLDRAEEIESVIDAAQSEAVHNSLVNLGEEPSSELTKWADALNEADNDGEEDLEALMEDAE